MDSDTGNMMDKGQAAMNAMPDQEVLARIHKVNQMEMDLGKLAQQQGAMDSVRRFGAMLEKDHAQGDRELTAMAKKQNLTLGEPQAQNEFDKRNLDEDKETQSRLKGLQGASFDREFANAMLQAHSDMMALVEQARDHTSTAALRDYYGKVLTTLRHHRDMAADIVADIQTGQMGNTGTAGTGTGTSDDTSSSGSTSGTEDENIHKDHDMGKDSDNVDKP